MAQSAITVMIDSEMTLEEINAEIRAARKEKYEDEEKKPHTRL